MLALLILVVGEVVASYLCFGAGADARSAASGVGGTVHVIWVMATPAVIAALVAYPFFRSAYWRGRTARGFALSYPVWESARYCARCDAVWIPPAAAAASAAVADLPGFPAQRMLSTTEFRLVLRRVGGFEHLS
ncbi:MAG TPA: hypothetical protein VGX23_25660 [Actinocrinis sp.]|nr:hypothetical protein [Actinocrinis sp.]